MTRTGHSALRRLLRDCGGNTSVEAGFILPVFLMMIFGLFYFAYAMFAAHEMSNALLAAARYAMVHGSASGSPASVQQIKNQVAAGSKFLDPARLTVTVQFVPDNKPGSAVTLTAKYQLASLPMVELKHALTIGDQTRTTIMN